MKQTLLLFMGLCLTLFLGLLQEASAQQDWQPVLSKDGVNVFSREADIADHANDLYERVVLLRFENTNDFPVDISWHYDLSYDGNCITCNDVNGEYNKLLALDAGQVFEVKAERESDAAQLRIFKEGRYTNSRLTGFVLRDFFVDYEDKQ